LIKPETLFGTAPVLLTDFVRKTERIPLEIRRLFEFT
jgi:hypothetical protein